MVVGLASGPAGPRTGRDWPSAVWLVRGPAGPRSGWSAVTLVRGLACPWSEVRLVCGPASRVVGPVGLWRWSAYGGCRVVGVIGL